MLVSKYLKDTLRRKFLAPTYPIYRKYLDGLPISEITEYEKNRPNQIRDIGNITEESVETMLNEHILIEDRINRFEVQIKASSAKLLFQHTPITTKEDLVNAMAASKLTEKGYDDGVNAFQLFNHTVYRDCCGFLGIDDITELAKASDVKKHTDKENVADIRRSKDIQHAIALLESEGYSIIEPRKLATAK